MTEIKRSFCVFAVFTALIVLLPIIGTRGIQKNVVSRLRLSHGLVTKVLFDSNSGVSDDIVYDIESVKAIACKKQSSSLDSVTCNEDSNALSNVSQSLIFSIAGDYSSPISITESERKMIAAAVQLEVLGKYSEAYQFERPDLKYYEMLAVAQIVRNRYESDSFPDDIKTVIYDSSYTSKGKVYQFSTSPYISGVEPTDLAYAAVDEVFSDGFTVIPEDYYYFCASWRESRFEVNNRSVLKFVGSIGDFDKITADATTFYAGVTIDENKANGYVF